MRHENWPTLLAEFFAEHAAQPFAWGERDCCLFACNGIRAITGLDPAAKVFRGQYRDAAGAMRLVRKHGGVEAIAEKQCAEFGFAELATPKLAQRGDVVLVDTPAAGPALGLCDGSHGVFPGHDGLSRVPIAECRRAWRVA